MTPSAEPVAQRRVFQGRRIWQVSDDLFAAAVTLLAATEYQFPPDLIIGIRRGGQPLATALAEHLNVPHLLISARHNPDDQVAVQGTGHVILDLSDLDPQPVTGQRVLLVDDICGSGSTLRAVTAALEPVLAPSAVRTAVLCRNTGADLTPDSWVWDVSDWTVFCWEQQPTSPTELLPLPTHVRHP